MISFIIPAHNEEAHLPKTLQALQVVIEQLTVPSEIIVANDASNDRTEAIALEHGATVVNVAHRHISATRNSGGEAAQGEFLFFIDADTEVNYAAIQSGLNAMESGAAGGGCIVQFSNSIPWWAAMLMPVATYLGRKLKLLGGACLFCTRETFFAIGGFDLKYYAAEDIAFVRAVKKQGQFFIPDATIKTSPRKFNSMSFFRFLPLLFRLVFRGPESFKTRRGLELWYEDAVRDKSERP